MHWIHGFKVGNIHEAACGSNPKAKSNIFVVNILVAYNFVANGKFEDELVPCGSFVAQDIFKLTAGIQMTRHCLCKTPFKTHFSD